MTKEISANELNKVASRLEKEAGENIEMAKAMRAFADAQNIRRQLASDNEVLERKIMQNKECFAESEEVLKNIELAVVSAEEKAEAKVVDVLMDSNTRIKNEADRANKKMEEIGSELRAKERDADVTIEGYKKVEDEASRKAGTAVAKKEEAEAALNAVKDNILI